MPLFKKPKMADFFLTEAHPYSKKRSIKLVHVLLVLGTVAAIVMIIGTYLDNKAKHEQEVADAARAAAHSANPQASGRGSASSQVASDNSYVGLQSAYGRASGRSGRERSASQIIKRGEAAGDVLPMGTLVRVRLLGQVESVDSNSPVAAIVLEDALSPSQSIVIPRGTKVIGSGQLDNPRERLQVRFHTLVFPEGEQYGLSGLAAMPDGTSGLSGNYSSGSFKKHAGQFIGTFIGGLADGMKDRTAVGQSGIPFETGSLKNGALNGVAQSSMNYAKSSSEEMGNSGASIKIPSGKEFVLYLEREFHP